MTGDSNCDKPTTGRVRNKRVAWLARGLNWPAMKHKRFSRGTAAIGLVVIGGAATVGRALLVSGDAKPAAVVDFPANSNPTPAPVYEFSEDEIATITRIIEGAGLVGGQLNIIRTEPAYDTLGNVAGVMAVAGLVEPFNGQLVLPGMRIGIADDGEEVEVGFDVTYDVQNLTVLSYAIDLERQAVRFAAPGDLNDAFFEPKDGSYKAVANGPERRLDGIDGPIPPRQEGL